MKPKYNYPVHPLANLFPALSDDDYRELKASIARNGQQVPVTLDKDGAYLLDGRNRIRACKDLGIEPRIERLDDSKICESDFIWSINVFRRHLTDDQRAALAHAWSDTERAAAKERQKAGVKTPLGESTQRSRDAIAKRARVSTHKVRQAESIAKDNPKALADVAAGKTTLKEAMPKPEPREPEMNAATWTERFGERAAQPETNVVVKVEPRPSADLMLEQFNMFRPGTILLGSEVCVGDHGVSKFAVPLLFRVVKAGRALAHCEEVSGRYTGSYTTPIRFTTRKHDYRSTTILRVATEADKQMVNNFWAVVTKWNGGDAENPAR